MTNGTLPNSPDTNFRAVDKYVDCPSIKPSQLMETSAWPAFSFSVDLGIITPGAQVDPVVWSLGLVRDPLVTYTANGPEQSRRAYYWSKYSSVEQAVCSLATRVMQDLSLFRCPPS